MTKKNSSSLNLFLEAVSFAARAHKGQLRKDKKTPYVAHPFRVAFLCRHLFSITDERILCMALLHDVLEDTKYSFSFLKKMFGRDIARGVRFLSKNRSLAEKKREAIYCRQLSSAPEEVKMVKLADLYDNMTDALHLGNRKKILKISRRAQGYLKAMKKNSSVRLKAFFQLLEEKLRQLEVSELS